MCLQIYLATDSELTLTTASPVVAEKVNRADSLVFESFQNPCVYFLHGRQLCGCGFPYVVADDFVEYFEGMFDARDEREEDIENAAGLLKIAASAIGRGGSVEVLAVWAGDEAQPPLGRVRRSLEQVSAETFVLTERFVVELQ